MAASAGRLCAQCDYDLRGSAPAGPCPECTTIHDAGSRRWWLRRPTRLFYWILMGELLMLLLWALEPLRNFRTIIVLHRYWELWPWPVLVLGLLGMRAALRPSTYFVARTPEGFIVQQRERVTVSWSHLYSVTRTKRGILITSGRTTLPIELTPDMFKRGEFEEVCSELTSRTESALSFRRTRSLRRLNQIQWRIRPAQHRIRPRAQPLL